MLGFPLPYRDELLYSTIARHGVHSGITSPKELLQDVFGDAKIVATSDLPGHLTRIAALYPEGLGITPIHLLYKHTLFPVYAPFVGEGRRKTLIHKLAVSGKNAVHLTVGVTASRIKQPLHLRYCPGCVYEQLSEYGECYWRRSWQVVGAESCPEHGRLTDSKILRHDMHRHSFQAVDEASCPLIKQQPASWQSNLLAESVENLLNLGPIPVPEVDQWGLWYRGLAIDHRFNRGGQIRHDMVRDQVVRFWGFDWLVRYGLFPESGESFWLRAMFRKHRNAFSYLEHLVVLHALLEAEWTLSDVVRSVVRLKSGERTSISKLETPDKDQLKKYRNKWLSAVVKQGTKKARLSGFGAVYAWLYCHDRAWLMETNERHKKVETDRKARVDWLGRDKNTVRELIVIRDQSEQLLYTPRRSMSWYLNKLEHKTSIEKNLQQMPRCRLFFERCCESIFEYQIRRITRTVIRFTKEGKPLKRWQLLRCSGMSEERLTEQARMFLREIVRV